MSLFTFVARGMAAAAMFCSATAFAAPITFIYSGFGSGSLAGTAFGGTDFTISAVGDTSNKVSCGGACASIAHNSASITIAGVGTFDFTTGTRTFFSDGANIAGFSRSGVPALDLLNTTPPPLLDGWDMVSSIGPVSMVSSLLQWDSPFPSVFTNGGQLIFTDGRNDSTFQAIVGPGVVPEPASLALASLALLGCVAASRRRGA